MSQLLGDIQQFFALAQFFELGGKHRGVLLRVFFAGHAADSLIQCR
jgi:hypothetical protein